MRIGDPFCNLVGSAVQSRRNAQESAVTVKTDTTFIHDTIIVREPVLRTIRQTDTLLVKVQTTDTLRLRDTLYISLPREQKEYSGEDYRAWVSGCRPQLDSLQIYPQPRGSKFIKKISEDFVYLHTETTTSNCLEHNKFSSRQKDTLQVSFFDNRLLFNPEILVDNRWTKNQV